MRLFVDTSALLAVLDADDEHHPRADKLWKKILAANETVVSSNYVLVETLALLQHRFGLEAVRVFQNDVVPAMTIHWVDKDIHEAAAGGMLLASRRKLSLVDCSSFEIMRRMGIDKAFAFDRHFREQGFELFS